MKLRIKGNTLRLRLTQGEIRALAERGQVESRTEFPGGTTLVYRLRTDDENQELSVIYKNNLMEFTLSSASAERWCGTDQVTVSAERDVPGGKLQLVLEKDFACLVPRPGEDESDHFPHPEAGHGPSR
ncbi:hypothetical protein B2A_14108, partial [mine drainage metagenome]